MVQCIARRFKLGTPAVNKPTSDAKPARKRVGVTSAFADCGLSLTADITAMPAIAHEPAPGLSLPEHKQQGGGALWN